MSRQRSAAQSERRTTAEWVALSIACVVLGCVIAAVMYFWLRPYNEPPRFTLEAGAVRQVGERYYLSISLRNDGELTATQVTIVATLPGDPPEEASTTIDFVPGRSTLESVFIFRRDPAGVDLRVSGYQEP